MNTLSSLLEERLPVIVAQINESWRVTLTSHRGTGHRRAWLLQRLDDGVWCDVAQVRTAETLQALVRRYAGHVDAAAAVILASLPPRVDVRVRGSESTVGHTEENAPI